MNVFFAFFFFFTITAVVTTVAAADRDKPIPVKSSVLSEVFVLSFPAVHPLTVGLGSVEFVGMSVGVCFLRHPSVTQ